MKYLLVGLFSLPLLTACTTIQEEYYGPYDQSPPPRSEVYRYVEPGQDHGHRPTQYQQGVYPAGRGRQIQERGPSNVHSHGQSTVVVPQNTHGHGKSSAVVPQNTHGHSENSAIRPQNTHGHGKSSAVVPQNTHGHEQSSAVVPQNIHGYGKSSVVRPQNIHGHGQSSVVRPQNQNTHGHVATNTSSHSGTIPSNEVKKASEETSQRLNKAHAHN
jgi:hypothetical protein